MPTYDYHCESNDRTIEVKHPIATSISNWGELCALAGTTLGDTPAEAPVRKLFGGANVVKSSSLRNNEPACASGGPCCGAQSCGFAG